MNWDKVARGDVLFIKTSNPSIKFCNKGRTCTVKRLIRENGKVVEVEVHLHCTTSKPTADFGVTHTVDFPILGRPVKVSRNSVVIPSSHLEWRGKPNSLAY